MPSPQLKAKLIQAVYRALPNAPTLCQKFDVESDDEAVRFEWWGIMLRLNADTLNVTQIEPDGVRIISRTSMLAEKLISDEVRREPCTGQASSGE